MSKQTLHTAMLSPSDVAFILDPTRPVLTHCRSMVAESAIEPHAHPRGQLLWSAKGILRVTSEKAVWVVPTTHAVWIPGGHYHQVSNETATQTRNLYIDPSFCVRQNSDKVVMLKMSSLMREVILRLTENADELTQQRAHHLGLVALDELESLPALELYIPSGHDPRLQRLISIIVNQPEQSLLLEQLATEVGASVRTIERLFKAETGLTFRQWRSRFRLMNSLEKITQGSKTTLVAHELGYNSVSSFISSFKEMFGCTPQEYAQR
ncbi:AraC family transcriptional regulator [Vibrio navarrensis]|uniref:AraC family transcriptional regulator n=1 Tax=Vibrio navarrensis TaxID=29495 RepID=UPI00051CC9D1|nr:helix-turn-helix transcriptional regulator [Vibrio navarrensis]KGK13962.1 AraC family transcriptional regulator [Vibrio navarrensis]KGK21458.1 AraC family transcriptional regulator [Vibrio navarrensis]